MGRRDKGWGQARETAYREGGYKRHVRHKQGQISKQMDINRDERTKKVQSFCVCKDVDGWQSDVGTEMEVGFVGVWECDGMRRVGVLWV